jgi:hypothetical protein
MKEFWKSSPEWQRKEEACEAFEAAKRKREKAGERILSAVASFGPEVADLEYERRVYYIETRSEEDDAFYAWTAALDAFEASPAGQAYHAWLRDPIVRETTKEAA